MNQVVSALYNNIDDAQRSVDALIRAGFARAQISIIANDATGTYAERYDSKVVRDNDVSGGEGATFGAVSGALIGLGALLIPGIGPVVAGGPLIAALVGGGVGALAGGLTGGVAASLIHLGVDEDTAGYYSEGVRRGGTLVTVEAVTQAERDRAADILDDYMPVDRDVRTSEWRETGWSKFDETDAPYTADQIEAERRKYLP